ncbi:MAG TPA: GntR family transcriptional regulator [Actinophytocola sp.]|uniref:GntR family transcriptional regulator n=1 Tax=Actinophytocola sp. TaxID=1872138 RepID=UPI002DDCEF01|nr:GntR family transcriptional regulator [Actinophytocola sp.]HEV2784169.1 GntR family transcriptional regulator [Actinophytocola sp.]
MSVELPNLAERVSLREQVANALRAAMISGQLQPGVVYSAPALATTFGVSATPVREAMLDLAKEGLVEAVRNRGFRVTELSERDLDELTELRMLIEVPTTARLAGRLDRAAIAELRELSAAIEAGAAAGDLIAYLDADREFHLTLLGHAGNRHLVDLVGELRSRARLYGLGRLAESGVLVDSAREHTTLVELLERGDPDAAESLIRHHIQHVRGSWAAQ